MQAIYNAGAAGKCEAPVPPVILTQPQSQAAFVGANVTINVVATGSIPLSFQWRLNGTNLVEGTNASLTFNNVQPGNAGNYSVVVSNLAGSVVSSNAVLAVLPQGSCVAPPDGIVAWWPGETNANDLAGGNTGILVNGVSFGPGEVGKCFLFDGVNDQVLVPASADLNVRSFTVEAWINPADIQTKRPIIEYAAPTGRAGVHLWLSVAPTGASSSPGTLFANIRDIS
ncbi:MAG: immunoglobulin domain-containing protein, partial [Chloroflexi bacterium]|nr:immunoglobulin domain-containing protein [Chloroflexota bacterium]